MSLSFRGWKKCALAVAIAAVAPALSVAQEVEPNDDFPGAQAVAGDVSGTTLISGELTLIPFDPNVFETSSFHVMEPGVVNIHDYTGLPAGAAYAAYIDNTVGDGTPDTVMHSLDEFGDEISFNDDGSPFGDGLASGFLSTINEDGSLHLEVSGFFDYDFDGLEDDTLDPHPQEGDYELIIKLGPFGDVDYFKVTGLLPGSAWSAETLAAPGEEPLDTVLTLYGESGEMLDQNDDIDFGGGVFLSGLSGIVPASGEIILAATAFPDLTNVGAHLNSGLYGLELTYTAVPEPSTLAMVGVGTLGAVLAIRRRK
jgi:hypothetical protein